MLLLLLFQHFAPMPNDIGAQLRSLIYVAPGRRALVVVVVVIGGS